MKYFATILTSIGSSVLVDTTIDGTWVINSAPRRIRTSSGLQMSRQVSDGVYTCQACATVVRTSYTVLHHGLWRVMRGERQVQRGGPTRERRRSRPRRLAAGDLK
jgi:hypothetical protein